MFISTDPIWLKHQINNEMAIQLKRKRKIAMLFFLLFQYNLKPSKMNGISELKHIRQMCLTETKI